MIAATEPRSVLQRSWPPRGGPPAAIPKPTTRRDTASTDAKPRVTAVAIVIASHDAPTRTIGILTILHQVRPQIWDLERSLKRSLDLQPAAGRALALPPPRAPPRQGWGFGHGGHSTQWFAGSRQLLSVYLRNLQEIFWNKVVSVTPLL